MGTEIFDLPEWEATPRRIVQQEKMRLGFRTRNLYKQDDRKPHKEEMVCWTSTMHISFPDLD
jgi:hypothetical protein